MLSNDCKKKPKILISFCILLLTLKSLSMSDSELLSFLEEAAQTRSLFISCVQSLDYNVTLLTQCESLLIMYDQMTYFLKLCSQPSQS